MPLLFLWSFIGHITLKNCQQPILTDASLEHTFNGNVTAALSFTLLSRFLGFSCSHRRQLSTSDNMCITEDSGILLTTFNLETGRTYWKHYALKIS